MMTDQSNVNSHDLRADLQEIANLIPAGSKILEIGCADGDLLHWLVHHKNCEARGMELGQEGVNNCIAKGLYVVQGDADTDLQDYPDQSFDYVILSRTLQAVHRPRDVVQQLLRIGKKAIVSIPNFGHWKIRWQLLTKGRMPVTRHLDYSWYDTPNIHFCTIRDLVNMVEADGFKIAAFTPLNAQGRKISTTLSRANWSAHQALFTLQKGETE